MTSASCTLDKFCCIRWKVWATFYNWVIGQAIRCRESFSDIYTHLHNSINVYIHLIIYIYIYIRYICFLCKSVCMPQLPLANWPICFFYENLIYFFVVFFFKVHSNEQAGWWRHGGCFGGRETLTPDCPIWVPIGRFLHPWETAPPGAVETAKFLCRL